MSTGCIDKGAVGVSRADGKCPDGLTLVPWQALKNAIWDVTMTNAMIQILCY